MWFAHRNVKLRRISSRTPVPWSITKRMDRLQTGRSAGLDRQEVERRQVFRMRFGGARQVSVGLALVLWGTLELAASAQSLPPLPSTTAAQPLPMNRSDTPVRMTVELGWRPPAQGARALPAVELVVSDGQIVEAVLWPDDPAWRVVLDAGTARVPLGQGQTGKVRARVEAPIGATLQLHFGDHVVKFPLNALLDGPLRLAQAGMVEVEASRVGWDSLEVRLGDNAFDGTLAPGSSVPLMIGTNILTPEPAEVTVSLAAELRPARGGDPVWRLDRQDFTMATNGLVPARALTLPVPKVEGTYVLDVKATWVPSESAEGSRLARWWRRRRQAPAEPATVARRVTLAILAPKATAAENVTSTADVRVDLCDLGRARGAGRAIASGRTPRGGANWSWTVPDGAWVQSGRLDRLKGLLPRVGPDPAQLAGLDASGVAWTALGLKVPHPGKAHRLTVSVTGGHPSAVGVGLLFAGIRFGAEGVAWSQVALSVLSLWINASRGGKVIGRGAMRQLADVWPPLLAVGVAWACALAVDEHRGGWTPNLLLRCMAAAAAFAAVNLLLWRPQLHDVARSLREVFGRAQEGGSR